MNPNAANPISIEMQVHLLRPYLLKFAQLQLRDPHRAEDAVSETVVAVLSKPKAFEGRSQLKTYLLGILKFKILDQFRANKHLVFTDQDLLEQDDDVTQEVFLSDGHFASPPEAWHEPSNALQTRQFFEVLETCLAGLTPQLSRIFMMREWLELSSEEICKQLGLSQTNLHVSLHRARMRLRACLEVRWFSSSTTKAT